MNAQTIMQARIDAQQTYDAIEYARRSADVCGGFTHCIGIHGAQLVRGQYAAARILGRGEGAWRTIDRWWLHQAKKVAAAELKAAKAAVKTIGGIRQLRLALAGGGAHEFALAA